MEAHTGGCNPHTGGWKAHAGEGNAPAGEGKAHAGECNTHAGRVMHDVRGAKPARVLAIRATRAMKSAAA